MVTKKKLQSEASSNIIYKENRNMSNDTDVAQEISLAIRNKNTSSCKVGDVFYGYEQAIIDIFRKATKLQPIVLHVPGVFDFKVSRDDCKVKSSRIINIYDDYILDRIRVYRGVSPINSKIILDKFYEIFSESVLVKDERINFMKILIHVTTRSAYNNAKNKNRFIYKDNILVRGYMMTQRFLDALGNDFNDLNFELDDLGKEQ